MFCKKCGQKIPDDSRFCPYCGTDNTVDFLSETAEENGKTIVSHMETQSSPKKDPVKQGKKTGLTALLILVFIAVIGLAIYAVIKSGNVTTTTKNPNETSIKVYVYDTAAGYGVNSETEETIKDIYSKYYLYKDANGWAIYNPEAKTTAWRIDNGRVVSKIKEEVIEDGGPYVLLTPENGDKSFFLMVFYKDLPDSEAQKIAAEIIGG